MWSRTGQAGNPVNEGDEGARLNQIYRTGPCHEVPLSRTPRRGGCQAWCPPCSLVLRAL